MMRYLMHMLMLMPTSHDAFALVFGLIGIERLCREVDQGEALDDSVHKGSIFGLS